MANVIESTFKLIRATKRRPTRGEHDFPPTVGHLLGVLKDNDGASSAELCEVLDVRPSSMSELLTRMEEHGLVERKTSEADRRVTRVFLSQKGADTVAQIAEMRAKAEAEFSACFTEEEKLQFCALADKLAKHLEEIAPKAPAGRPHGGPCHGGPCRGRGHAPFGGPRRLRRFHR